MNPVHTKTDLNILLSQIKKENKSVGMVPTMGALHQGHAALIKKAISENDLVVVTIFVNPTQFDNQEDLKKYPKTLEKDLQLLRNISEKIIVFVPSVSEIYTDQLKSKKYNFDGLDKVMEGAFRKGHFNGVGTIVEKLLTLVLPDRAYFGEKDYQQLQIIKKLVQIKDIPVKIIGCPIVREPHGLALSSRNERLSPELRKEAAFIYKILKKTKEKFSSKSAGFLKKWVEKQFKNHSTLQLEYIQITDGDTLRPLLRKQKNKRYRALIAVYATGVRLIDNIALN